MRVKIVFINEVFVELFEPVCSQTLVIVSDMHLGCVKLHLQTEAEEKIIKAMIIHSPYMNNYKTAYFKGNSLLSFRNQEHTLKDVRTKV